MEGLLAVGRLRNDDIIALAIFDHVFDERFIQERHIAGCYEGMITGGIEKTGVDPSQSSLAFYDVSGDGAILIEVVKRAVGDKDRLPENAAESPDGPVDQPLPSNLQKGFICAHSGAFTA